MNLCFLTGAGINAASARLRAYWVAEHIPGAQVINVHEREIPEADVYVWSKIADPEEMKRQRDRGATVVWDACEPAWWWEPRRVREITVTANHLVACTEPLAEDLEAFSGLAVKTIPDRLDLAHFQRVTEPRGRKPGEALRLIWYGYSQNRHGIYSALAYLERLIAHGVGLELTIMDDRPDVRISDAFAFPVYHTAWRYDLEVDIITSHDLALLPPYPGPWGRMKSNNRTLTAWACGVPVVSGEDWGHLWQMATLTDLRQAEQQRRREEIVALYDVKLSAAEWQELIA